MVDVLVLAAIVLVVPFLSIVQRSHALAPRDHQQHQHVHNNRLPDITGQPFVSGREQVEAEMQQSLLFVRLHTERTSGVVRSDAAGWCSRKDAITKICSSAAGAVLLGMVVFVAEPAMADEEETILQPRSITPCRRLTFGDAPPQCVSTASVRQIDQYVPPWSYRDDVTPDRAWQALVLAVQQQKLKIVTASESIGSIQATASRNLGAVDQIDFVLNPVDHVVTYSSQQVSGPEFSSSIGTQRQRLQDLRKSFYKNLGGSTSSSSEMPLWSTESAVGQLKAFYGLQGGSGFERIVLDLDDYD